jgi:hypothetical protein
MHGADEKLLVVPGEEVTARAGDKPVHVNGPTSRVVLDDVATERSLAVKIRSEGVSKYRVQFIGRGGQILTEVASATYTFKATRATCVPRWPRAITGWRGCSLC